MGGNGRRLDLGATRHIDHAARMALVHRRPLQRAARSVHLPHTDIQAKAILPYQKATW